MRLSNKTAIVTGAGAGIGEATVLRLAEEGARVLVVDLNDGGGRAVAEKVNQAGGRAAPLKADISSEADAARISETALQEFGGIDILVNNAADFTTQAVENATTADWQRVLGVNVIGTAMVSKYAIPHMKAKGGSIVNVSSMSAIIAQPNFATYNTSKGAILTMTDLAPFRIRVNSVCPGCIRTSASEREWIRMGETKEQWCARQAPLHMLNRVGEAVEVANAILFLASDESSFITAAELLVDGGYVAK
jgi:NAD(P)-dependent dehydrogenase (short-subunit alcohol dehydrogenase family)